MPRCVIFGGCGFLGTHIGGALVRRGHAVCAFDRVRGLAGLPAEVSREIEVRLGSWEDDAAMQSALVGADAVVHCVGLTLPHDSNENMSFDVTANVVGSVRLLEAARRAGVRRILLTSSGGTVYGVPRRIPIDEEHPTDPICSYGITKLAAEKYLHLYRHLHGIEYAALRISNPYGPGQNPRAAQGAVAVFLGRLARGEPIEIWGDGGVVRDYVFIGDVAEAAALALELSGPVGVVNIGSGRGTSLNELVEALFQTTGSRVPVHHFPPRRSDVPANVLDISRARRLLGWSPRTELGAGLARTWEWILAAAGGSPGLSPR